MYFFNGMLAIKITDSRVSPVGETGNTPTTQRIGLRPPPVPLPLFCPKNIDFVIFMQFFAILPKMSTTSRTVMGNLDSSKNFYFCTIEQKIVGAKHFRV